MQSHPLDGDGMNAELFKYLLRASTSVPPDDFEIQIPETILYYNGCASFWYYYDENGPAFRKRGAKELEKSIIFNHFMECNKGSQCDIVAQFCSARSTALDITYLTKKELEAFLFSPETRDGILQTFVKPKGDHNEVIQWIWSPSLTFAVKRTNRRKLYDRTCSSLDRCATFDGPTHLAEEYLCTPHMATIFQSLMEPFIRCLGGTHDNNIAVARAVFYFKVDANNTKWLLFSSSIRMVERLDAAPLGFSPTPGGGVNTSEQHVGGSRTDGGASQNLSTTAHGNVSSLSLGGVNASSSAPTATKPNPKKRKAAISPLALMLNREVRKGHHHSRDGKQTAEKVFLPVPDRLLSPLKTCVSLEAEQTTQAQAMAMQRRLEKIAEKKAMIQAENKLLSADLKRLQRDAVSLVPSGARSSTPHHSGRQTPHGAEKAHTPAGPELIVSPSSAPSSVSPGLQPRCTSAASIASLRTEGTASPPQPALSVQVGRSFRALLPLEGSKMSRTPSRVTSAARKAAATASNRPFSPTMQSRKAATEIVKSAKLCAEQWSSEYIEVSAELADALYAVEQELADWKRTHKPGQPETLSVEEAPRITVRSKTVRFLSTNIPVHFTDLHATLLPAPTATVKILTKKGRRNTLGVSTPSELCKTSSEGTETASTKVPGCSDLTADPFCIVREEPMTHLVFTQPLASVGRCKLVSDKLLQGARHQSEALVRSATCAAERLVTSKFHALLESIRAHYKDYDLLPVPVTQVESEPASPVKSRYTSHSALLQQIRSGVRLKKAASRENSMHGGTTPASGSISPGSPLDNVHPSGRAALLAQLRQNERRRLEHEQGNLSTSPGSTSQSGLAHSSSSGVFSHQSRRGSPTCSTPNSASRIGKELSGAASQHGQGATAGDSGRRMSSPTDAQRTGARSPSVLAGRSPMDSSSNDGGNGGLQPEEFSNSHVFDKTMEQKDSEIGLVLGLGSPSTDGEGSGSGSGPANDGDGKRSDPPTKPIPLSVPLENPSTAGNKEIAEPTEASPKEPEPSPPKAPTSSSPTAVGKMQIESSSSEGSESSSCGSFSLDQDEPAPRDEPVVHGQTPPPPRRSRVSLVGCSNLVKAVDGSARRIRCLGLLSGADPASNSTPPNAIFLSTASDASLNPTWDGQPSAQGSVDSVKLNQSGLVLCLRFFDVTTASASSTLSPDTFLASPEGIPYGEGIFPFPLTILESSPTTLSQPIRLVGGGRMRGTLGNATIRIEPLKEVQEVAVSSPSAATAHKAKGSDPEPTPEPMKGEDQPAWLD